MSYVLVVYGSTSGPCAVAGQYLHGIGTFTKRAEEAKQFATRDDALTYWAFASRAHPHLTCTVVPVARETPYVAAEIEMDERKRREVPYTEAEIAGSQRRLEWLFGFGDEGETS